MKSFRKAGAIVCGMTIAAFVAMGVGAADQGHAQGPFWYYCQSASA
jgi:hypothetical protein